MALDTLLVFVLTLGIISIVLGLISIFISFFLNMKRKQDLSSISMAIIEFTDKVVIEHENTIKVLKEQADLCQRNDDALLNLIQGVYKKLPPSYPVAKAFDTSAIKDNVSKLLGLSNIPEEEEDSENEDIVDNDDNEMKLGDLI